MANQSGTSAPKMMNDDLTMLHRIEALAGCLAHVLRQNPMHLNNNNSSLREQSVAISQHLHEIESRTQKYHYQSRKQPRRNLQQRAFTPDQFQEFHQLLTHQTDVFSSLAYHLNYYHARLQGRRSMRLYFEQQQVEKRQKVLSLASHYLGMHTTELLGPSGLELSSSPMVATAATRTTAPQPAATVVQTPPPIQPSPVTARKQRHAHGQRAPPGWSCPPNNSSVHAPGHTHASSIPTLVHGSVFPGTSLYQQNGNLSTTATTGIKEGEDKAAGPHRLRLLMHASSCDRGTLCSEFGVGVCASMKMTWEHARSCQDDACQAKQCRSSRSLWLHASQCKKGRECSVCAPALLTVNAPPVRRRGSTSRGRVPLQEPQSLGRATPTPSVGVKRSGAETLSVERSGAETLSVDGTIGMRGKAYAPVKHSGGEAPLAPSMPPEDDDTLRRSSIGSTTSNASSLKAVQQPKVLRLSSSLGPLKKRRVTLDLSSKYVPDKITISPLPFIHLSTRK